MANATIIKERDVKTGQTVLAVRCTEGHRVELSVVYVPELEVTTRRSLLHAYQRHRREQHGAG